MDQGEANGLEGCRWHRGKWENILGDGVRLIGSGASLEAKLMGLDDGLDKGCRARK